MIQYIKPRIARSIKLGTPKKHFELTEKQIERLKTVSQVVLAVAAVAGFVFVATVAPNVFQLLDKVSWGKRTYRSRDTKSKDRQKRIIKSFYYLKRSGYIELVPEGNDFRMKITQKGRKKIQKMQFADLRIKTGKSWDKHWWIVIADIPQDLRHQADNFREKLKAMKFYPLQRTVWCYPFDPLDEIDFISAYFNVDRFVTVMEVSRVDPNDEKLLLGYFREQAVL